MRRELPAPERAELTEQLQLQGAPRAMFPEQHLAREQCPTRLVIDHRVPRDRDRVPSNHAVGAVRHRYQQLRPTQLARQ